MVGVEDGEQEGVDPLNTILFHINTSENINLLYDKTF